jgi:hypothetical protein
MCSTAHCCHSRSQSDLGAWGCSSVLSRHPHPLARLQAERILHSYEQPSPMGSAGSRHAAKHGSKSRELRRPESDSRESQSGGIK